MRTSRRTRICLLLAIALLLGVIASGGTAMQRRAAQRGEPGTARAQAMPALRAEVLAEPELRQGRRHEAAIPARTVAQPADR